MTIGAAVLIAVALTATGDPGQAVLEKVDAASRPAKDTSFTLELSSQRKDGTEVVRKLKVWQAGDQRMVKILAPARLRGTGILTPGDGRLFVYLPAYKRVREITGREGGETFMGTNLSIDELALVRLARRHHAKLVGEAGGRKTLELTPKGDKDRHYASLLLEVGAEDHLVRKVDYRDESGKVTRTVTLGELNKSGGYAFPHRVEVKDHKSGAVTVGKAAGLLFDQGLSQGFFTERQLKRSP